LSCTEAWSGFSTPGGRKKAAPRRLFILAETEGFEPLLARITTDSTKPI
jgi:hypothetical protein